jgi:STE24 endopeptidase
MAHELGHWLYDHIVTGIALGGLALLFGFYVLARILIWAQSAFGIYGPSDPAGLPLVLLCGFLGSWLAMPLSCAVSRQFERQADMMALKLARQPDAFINAEKKLSIDNIGNVAPTPWNVWLFATHPPAVERIQMAEEWRRNRL